MKYRVAWLLIIWALFGYAGVWAQAPPDPDVEREEVYASYHAFKDSLQAAVAAGEVGALWQRLRDAHQVPFAYGDSVAFLYKGAASSVDWRGDFNGWGRDGPIAGRRIEGTDLWIAETTFAADARLDYKVVLGGNDWRLDPGNPLLIWSGFGPNSELRMPAYVYPRETVRRAGVPAGTLSGVKRLVSDQLSYAVNYRVYTPAGYDTLSGLPVLYVTDGHEYAADHLGSLPVVLDNLIAEGRITPVLAVFVDPREPGNSGNNRRQQEYIANDRFLAFMADELVRSVDQAYRTAATAEARGILGTSLGGLNSAFFGAKRPDVFRKIAIQSPAFWVWEDIYGLYRTEADTGLQVFVDHGLVRDGDGGPRLRAILEERGFDYRYIEVEEGHSWGHWRGRLDEILTYFWGTPAETGRDAHEGHGGYGQALRLEAFPNPTPGDATLRFEVPRARRASLYVYDLLGRRVETVFEDAWLAGGPHHVRVETSGWPNGTYFYHLQTPTSGATAPFVLVR